jgi:two-component system, OmpR family, sensor kinase
MSSPATEPRPAHSLRRRLLGLVLAAVALASFAQAAAAYRSALRNADALFDAQLQTLALSLEGGLPPGRALAKLGYSIEIRSPDGVLLFGLGRVRLPERAVIGFSEVTVDGVRHRLYTLRTSQRSVQIAQDLEARRARARAMALEAVLGVALLGLLLMLATWLVIDRSLAPVLRLREQVARRPAEDLSPLPAAGLPGEIQPLVDELNQLFARVRSAFASQQQFVSDAAHELRSPLAALQLQAQALGREPEGPRREEALVRLQGGIARTSALVHQLLVLARQEAGVPQPLAPTDLQALCRDVVAELLPLAVAKRIDLGLATPQQQAVVPADAEALRVLLRNLVDNAVKYTPPGGRVDLRIELLDGRTVLAVEDSGPGIAEPDRARMFERFARGGHDDIEGSGLGLSIVRAIAERHRALVRLGRSEQLGGLRAEVVFLREA